MTTFRGAAQQAIALIASARRRREEMTALREAAQQALEALEAGPDVDPFFAGETEDALRAALAEPVEEPVAYIHRQGNHWEVSELHLPEDEKARGWKEKPIYTTPPQRKPLTEEEIEKAYREIWRDLPTDFDHTSSGWIEQGIKYAERAHKIGGEG